MCSAISSSSMDSNPLCSALSGSYGKANTRLLSFPPPLTKDSNPSNVWMSLGATCSILSFRLIPKKSGVKLPFEDWFDDYDPP